jgi:uncharacterized spore protein YtfJ
MNYMATTDEMVRRIGSIPDELNAGACFGMPVERNGHTLIPVARINFGLGMGFGGGSGGKGVPGDFAAETEGGEGGGGGGGGGGSATPVAIIDITDNDVLIKAVEDTTRITLGAFMVAAWVAFWLFLTVRTFSHENSKTKRHAMDKGAI